MPGEVFYEDSVDRSLNSKLGERFSVLDISPIAGKGVDNESPVFAEAYDDKIKKGGGAIYVPGAVGPGYKLTTPLELAGTVPIEFIGEGRASRIYRGADMPTGKGMFELAGARKVTFRHLSFDGDVLTSAQLLYSEFGNDPAHPLLTTNSTFWLKGCEDITFEDCDFEHTGGYAAYIDARATDCRRIRFVRCRFRNNRPHTFGTAAADMFDPLRRVRGVKIDWERHFPDLLAGSASVYGSWTGGIFYHNQATGGSSRVQDLSVNGCRFERNTGNCVWGHGYGFTAFHQRIHVDYNTFLDCGLDGILFGNVVGGSAIGNSMRRIGYVCSDDAGPSVPRWLPNLNATGIDTSGVVKLVTYANNNFLNVNGGAINGDGFAYGTITGNTIRVSRPGEPEYSEDFIGSSFGPGGNGANWSQGVVTGNTSDKEGGLGITISGNFCDNLGGTAIGLFAARNCQASANTIIVPNAANQQPITIGGILTGANQVATGNIVTENRIQFAPASIAPAIFEDPTYRVFTTADVNNVIKNYCTGANVFEFQRDPNSLSTTALFFTTSSVATWQSRHGIMREGTAAGSALRFYAQDADAFGWLHMQLQMYWAVGQRGPLLNVSEWGPSVSGEGGVITTGNVTSMPYANAMATSKLSASGFLAMGDSTYWEVDANKLGSDWALLRWDGLLGKWQQSISTTGPLPGGVRIWTDFAGSSSGATHPGEPDQSVQFNDGGIFGGDAYFSYAKVTHQLTLFSFAYNGITMVNGGFLGENVNVRKYLSFVPKASLSPAGADSFTGNALLYADSPSGRLRLVRGLTFDTYEDYDFQSRNYFASGTANNAIQAASGGVTALTANFTHTDRFTVNVPNGGVNAKWLIANDFLVFMQKPSAAVSAPGEVRLYADTDNLMYISTNGQPYGPFMNSSPGDPEGSVQYNRGGRFAGNANLFWDEGVNRLYVTCASTLPAINVDGGWIQSAGGYQTVSTGLAVQALGGVIIGRYLATNESLLFKGLASPPGLSDASGGPQVRLYASSGGQMYISSNGAAWGPFGTGTLPASSDGAIQYNDAGSFGGHPNFYWHKTQFAMYLNTYAGQPGLTVTGGWIQSQGGFFTDNATAVAVNAQSGGVTARWIAANESLLFLQRSEPDRSTGGQVRLYANTNGVLYISTGGQPYGPLVTSALAAGTHSMVQYNNSGYFGAEAAFSYNDSSDTLTVPNITATGTTWGSVSSSGVISAVRFYSNVGDGEWQYLMNSPWRQWGFRTGSDGSQQWVDYSGGNAPLQIYGHTSPASIRLVTGGSVQANQFYSPYAGFDAVNAGNGGSYARSHRSAVYTQIGQNYGQGIAFTGGDSLQFGCLFYDTSVGVAKIYISSGWQAIATGTFSGITSTTQPSWTATNSGYSYTFNNSNGNFVVNGQGDVTAYGVITTSGPSGGFNCTGQQAKNSIQTYGGFNAGSGGGGNGVYQIGGSDVINNSRQFVGYGGVNTSGNLQSSAGTVIAPYYQVTGGYYGQDATYGIQVGGTTAPVKTLYFKSGILYYVG
jgi:hypothetical protein